MCESSSHPCTRLRPTYTATFLPHPASNPEVPIHLASHQLLFLNNQPTRVAAVDQLGEQTSPKGCGFTSHRCLSTFCIFLYMYDLYHPPLRFAFFFLILEKFRLQIRRRCDLHYKVNQALRIGDTACMKDQIHDGSWSWPAPVGTAAVLYGLPSSSVDLVHLSTHHPLPPSSSNLWTSSVFFFFPLSRGWPCRRLLLASPLKAV